MKYFAILVSALVLSFQGLAAKTKTSTQEDTGFFMFVGADFGMTKVMEDISSFPDKTGVHFAPKVLGSYYFDSFILDMGGGWFYDHIESSKVNVETKSAFLEGGLRYRMSDLWSFGPIFSLFLSNDNSFNELNRSKSSEPFMGLQVSYKPDLFNGFNRTRLNFTLVKDMAIDNRNVMMALVGFQMGFSFREAKPKVIQKIKVVEKVKVVQKEKIVYKNRIVPRIIKLKGGGLRATFDSDSGLNFKTNSSEGNEKMIKYLSRLSHFLNKYSREWKTLKVSGHTDNVGKRSYNMKLSRKRSNTVKRLLVAEGVAKKKIKTVGYGPDRPIDKRNTKRARAKNRRVELDFFGVKNQDSFYKNLSILQ